MTSYSSKKTARLLDGIRGPAEVKAIREQDLPQLAQEVREELIKVLSQTGGHLGPNLGVVELTIALHRVFNTPKDRFVFDVSHQGYVHKMFTGRLDRIGTMRQYQGLNGFLLRTESEHDCYGAGHAGTALSAALGMAVGRDLRRTRAALLRADRWARYSVADQNVRVFENAGRTGAAAHSNEKRKRVRACHCQAGQVPWSGQIQTRDWRNRSDADADLF